MHHYESDVRFWFNKNAKKCRNLYGSHKSANTYKTQEVSLQLAEDARKYTSHELIPSHRLCKGCLSKLQHEITSEIEKETVKAEEEIIEEETVDDLADPDWEIHPNVAEDDSVDGDDLKEIIDNMRDELPEYTKEQKIGIIKILPTSWTIYKICTVTGLSKRLGKNN